MLEDQLVFYGSYHYDSRNKKAHAVGVPLILWSVLVLLSNSWSIHRFENAHAELNFSFIVVCVYFVYYLYLEPVATILGSPILAFLFYSASYFSGLPGANLYAIIINFIAWAIQIVAHKIYEKRSPAFVDNFIQSFATAPFFVWFEFLFSIGYRPSLQKRVEERVKKNIEKFKRQ